MIKNPLQRNQKAPFSKLPFWVKSTLNQRPFIKALMCFDEPNMYVSNVAIGKL